MSFFETMKATKQRHLLATVVATVVSLVHNHRRSSVVWAFVLEIVEDENSISGDGSDSAMIFPTRYASLVMGLGSRVIEHWHSS